MKEYLQNSKIALAGIIVIAIVPTMHIYDGATITDSEKLSFNEEVREEALIINPDKTPTTIRVNGEYEETNNLFLFEKDEICGTDVEVNYMDGSSRTFDQFCFSDSGI